MLMKRAVRLDSARADLIYQQERYLIPEPPGGFFGSKKFATKKGTTWCCLVCPCQWLQPGYTLVSSCTLVFEAYPHLWSTQLDDMTCLPVLLTSPVCCSYQLSPSSKATKSSRRVVHPKVLNHHSCYIPPLRTKPFSPE